MRNALGWTMAAHMAQAVNGETRKQPAAFVVPLADRRRAMLIAELGDEAGEASAKEADEKDRATMWAGWKALVRK